MFRHLSSQYKSVIMQEHGQNKGDDLLASVRIIGRYDLVPLVCHFWDLCYIL